jgi:hypothetical protein
MIEKQLNKYKNSTLKKEKIIKINIEYDGDVTTVILITKNHHEEYAFEGNYKLFSADNILKILADEAEEDEELELNI